jgi:hypothetical protein
MAHEYSPYVMRSKQWISWSETIDLAFPKMNLRVIQMTPKMIKDG